MQKNGPSHISGFPHAPPWSPWHQCPPKACREFVQENEMIHSFQQRHKTSHHQRRVNWHFQRMIISSFKWVIWTVTLLKEMKNPWKNYTKCEITSSSLIPVSQTLRRLSLTKRRELNWMKSVSLKEFLLFVLHTFPGKVAFLGLSDVFWDSLHTYPQHYPVSLPGSELQFFVMDSQCCTGRCNFSDKLCRSHGEQWLSGLRSWIWFCFLWRASPWSRALGSYAFGCKRTFSQSGEFSEPIIKFCFERKSIPNVNDNAIVNNQLVFSYTDSEILFDAMKEKIILKLCRWEVNCIIKQDFM